MFIINGSSSTLSLYRNDECPGQLLQLVQQKKLQIDISFAIRTLIFYCCYCCFLIAITITTLVAIVILLFSKEIHLKFATLVFFLIEVSIICSYQQQKKNYFI
jgi:hypothetical protein